MYLGQVKLLVEVVVSKKLICSCTPSKFSFYKYICAAKLLVPVLGQSKITGSSTKT